MAKKQKSTYELYKSINERDSADRKKAIKKYYDTKEGDRGKAAEDVYSADLDRRIKAVKRDKELVYQYGRDAPKARSFGPDKQYSVSRTKTAPAKKPKAAK